MTRHRPRPRPALAAAAAVAALAAPLLAAGGSVASVSSSAAPDGGTLSLVAAPRAEMFASRGRAYGDLGLRFAASGGRVELRTTRAGWSKEPETRLFPGGFGDDTRWADGQVVPRSLMTGFDRLAGLLTVVVRDTDGEVVTRETSDGCLNGYEPQRTGPGSPATPYYPQGCPHNAFTVGSVQGVEDGYAVSPEDWTRLPIGPGTYEVTASVDPAWADVLGMTERRVVYSLRVRGQRGGGQQAAGEREGSVGERLAVPAGPGPRPAPSAAEHMSDMGGMTHSAATKPCDYTPAAGDPLPDLESLPAFGIDASGEDLRFSATVWNSGDSPLVVDGFRRDGEELMDAYQYFYSRAADGDLEQEGYCGVGAMHWHAAPSHHHWHFLDFARYRLLSVEEPGKVVRSTKQSFCLANTDAVDYTRPGADWHPYGTDLSSACGARSAQSLRQVLSAGSGDTYQQFRAGQAFRLKGLPNGWYQISVEANPRDLLHEADEVESRDVALRKVYIGGEPGARTVRVPAKGLVCAQPRNDCG